MVWGLSYENTYGQPEPDTVRIAEAEEDSMIYQTKTTIEVEAVATVRLSSTAKTYVKWTVSPAAATTYSFKYKIQGASSWTTVSNSTTEIILSSLVLDTTYYFEVIPIGGSDLSAFKYDEGAFSTREQHEPIEGRFAVFSRWS